MIRQDQWNKFQKEYRNKTIYCRYWGIDLYANTMSINQCNLCGRCNPCDQS